VSVDAGHATAASNAATAPPDLFFRRSGAARAFPKPLSPLSFQISAFPAPVFQKNLSASADAGSSRIPFRLRYPPAASNHVNDSFIRERLTSGHLRACPGNLLRWKTFIFSQSGFQIASLRC